MTNLKNFGSINNWMMANAKTTPIVDNYVTLCMYTDRYVQIVREISKDGKSVIVEDCTTIADKTKNCEMGHQNWVHYPNGRLIEYKLHRGNWCEVITSIVFIDEVQKKSNQDATFSEWLQDNAYDDDCNIKLIDGITRKKTTYKKVNLLFNASNYHYDWSF